MNERRERDLGKGRKVKRGKTREKKTDGKEMDRGMDGGKKRRERERREGKGKMTNREEKKNSKRR